MTDHTAIDRVRALVICTLLVLAGCDSQSLDRKRSDEFDYCMEHVADAPGCTDAAFRLYPEPAPAPGVPSHG